MLSLHQLNNEFFRNRRINLMQRMGPKSIAFLRASSYVGRNRDVHYQFRQDSDFYYITGLIEPDAIAVLKTDFDNNFMLFCHANNPYEERWQGPRIGTEGAVIKHAADQAYPLTEFITMLPNLIDGCNQIFCAIRPNEPLLKEIVYYLSQHITSAIGIYDLEHILHHMRLYKEPEEIFLIRESAHIATGAHRKVIQTCKPGLYEYQLEAEIAYYFMRHGATFSYPPIIGSGINSCILHYTDNLSQLTDGDIVLIDAGAEFAGYASDITRSIPINGCFSSAQRDVYEIVLAAQKAAIKLVQPGYRFNEPHDITIQILTEGLVSLGLLKGNIQDLITTGQYKKFYMHNTSHWLGMDVHDVGSYKDGNEWKKFEPGMVVTIEPGLYITEMFSTQNCLCHIGIRIEDEVLVTTSGQEILTVDIPKEIDDIEALMRS